MTLGKQIRSERKRIDMTGRELARRVGISAAYMCDIELDRRLPSLPVLRKIGKIIDVQYGCGHGPCRRCGAPWPKAARAAPSGLTGQGSAPRLGPMEKAREG